MTAKIPDKLFGRSYPLGATVYADGVNFSVYSKNAHSLELVLFDDVDDPKRKGRDQSQEQEVAHGILVETRLHPLQPGARLLP